MKEQRVYVSELLSNRSYHVLIASRRPSEAKMKKVYDMAYMRVIDYIWKAKKWEKIGYGRSKEYFLDYAEKYIEIAETILKQMERVLCK